MTTGTRPYRVTRKTAPAKPLLYSRVREILDAARVGIARTVNTTQVVANWLIGREIVEEEQRGRRWAGYGTELLSELAARLRQEFGAGYGVNNLELFRRFYLEYPRLLPEGLPDQISDAPRRKSDGPAVAIQIQHAVRAESWQALAIPVDSARRGAGECDAGCAHGAICAGWRER